MAFYLDKTKCHKKVPGASEGNANASANANTKEGTVWGKDAGGGGEIGDGRGSPGELVLVRALNPTATWCAFRKEHNNREDPIDDAVMGQRCTRVIAPSTTTTSWSSWKDHDNKVSGRGGSQTVKFKGRCRTRALSLQAPQQLRNPLGRILTIREWWASQVVLGPHRARALLLQAPQRLHVDLGRILKIRYAPQGLDANLGRILTISIILDRRITKKIRLEVAESWSEGFSPG
ncbi:hypothetical protein B0H12DRAFT_1066371 [Mycena haematopus]|nr:hypothetical protein B0H12DRAFT_1066371 [Mycena haematopus]